MVMNAGRAAPSAGKYGPRVVPRAADVDHAGEIVLHPRRFFELVSAIVQESAWVSVTRAAPAQAGLPRGRAQAMPQDAALQRAGRPGNALAAER